MTLLAVDIKGEVEMGSFIINSLYLGDGTTSVISGTQTISWIGPLRIVSPSADAHGRRLAEFSLIKQLTNFNLSSGLSPPDILHAAHILLLFPYADHPSFRRPNPST